MDSRIPGRKFSTNLKDSSLLVDFLSHQRDSGKKNAKI